MIRPAAKLLITTTAAAVVAVGGLLALPARQETVGPAIEGSPAFKRGVETQLKLLEDKSPMGHLLVTLYISRIYEQTCDTCPTGFDPVGHDGYGPTVYGRVTPADTIWPELAAARLVHEAAHGRLWAVCDRWWGEPSERLGNAWMADVLMQLKPEEPFYRWYAEWVRAHNHALEPGYPVEYAENNSSCSWLGAAK